jgi:predicted nucleic acid-binding protein
MIVIADTSPLNYLILIGAEGVLPRVFDAVIAPPAVLVEMLHPKAPNKVRGWATTPPAWLQVRAAQTVTTYGDLGPGESEAIALAIEIHADAILMDDRAAVAIANNLGLSSLGTLGVLDLAADKGLVDIRTVVAALAKTSFHASHDLIEQMIQRDELRRQRM